MRLSKNKTALKLLMTIFFTLIVAASYFSYLKYESYLLTKKENTISSFIKEIEFILSEIEFERIVSADYLATGKSSTFEKLNIKRVEVNNAIDNLLIYLDKNNRYLLYSQQINTIVDELKLVRREVNSQSSEYKTILFKTYNEKISNEFINILIDISENTKLYNIKNYLSIYNKYLLLRENTTLENTGIHYILSKQVKMSSQDLRLLQRVIEKDTLPKFTVANDSSVALDIQDLLSSVAYKEIVSKERNMILHEARRGDYSVSLVAWDYAMNNKMEYFVKVQSIIIEEIKNIENQNIIKKFMEVLLYGLSILIPFIFLLMVRKRYKKLTQNSFVSEETLKDVKHIFDLNQQKEITKLIEEGKADYIFKFLIQAIKDANHTKDLFLANMSHEIRTPLNGIVGFTTLLKDAETKEEQAEFISVIEKSSVNLLTIVNDILDFSKIKSDKIELESIEFDPIDTFEGAVETYAAKAAQENVDFNIFMDPELPTLLIGDPTKISQIIVNLISNAIKFTSENGAVNVTIKKMFEDNESAEVKFDVTDTGIGITDEQKKNIFTAFAQADVSTSRKYGGTGLGLSISGKFVEFMGGKLSITSKENVGSSFYFTLTLKKPVTSKRREVENFSSLSIGILDYHRDGDYNIDENLEAYIAYTGAKVRHFTDETLLSLKGTNRVPDIIFIDHKYRYRDEDIQKFLDLKSKIILMTTGNHKNNAKKHKDKIAKIIYKPMNFTKTMNAISTKEYVAKTSEKVMYKDIHVLVAEDNKINQKLITNVLNRVGIEVSVANNGKEAYEMRMENNYDIIFMDIQMPIMGGIESTVNILSYENKSGEKHIPIVALTANNVVGDRDKYMSVGMDGYLSKPLELAKLNELLKDYFEDRIV